MFARFVALSLGVLFAASAVASTGTPLELDLIRTQQAQIRADANARTGLYRDMPAGTRSQLLAKQDEVLATIEGKATADQLNEAQKLKVFNALEWIEATINKAEDERMICEQRTTIGSNRKTRVCMTVAEQRRMREEGRQRMMDGDPLGRR